MFLCVKKLIILFFNVLHETCFRRLTLNKRSIDSQMTKTQYLQKNKRKLILQKFIWLI